MPRIHRIVVPGQPHHVTQRGNNRMAVFLDDADALKGKELLLSASKRHGCAIHSYVLMGNHFHLLATPPAGDSLSRMMQSVELNYARYFNDRYERTGTLWEGRFGSTVIESGRYFFTCSRYIEMNPVRALLAHHPGTYRWSSFHRNATGALDALVTPHALYDALASDLQTRSLVYFTHFAGHLDPDVCDAIRKATRQRRVLGSDEFVANVEAKLQQRVRPQPHGGDRRINILDAA